MHPVCHQATVPVGFLSKFIHNSFYYNQLWNISGFTDPRVKGSCTCSCYKARTLKIVENIPEERIFSLRFRLGSLLVPKRVLEF